MRDKLAGVVDHLMNSGLFLEQAVEIVERAMIERALESTGGNQSAASKVLGIHRNTLQRKMIEYQLAPRIAQRKPPPRVNPPRRAKAG
jgi:Fis family transcriptional regulator, factor for inversion stimulation protein